MRTFVFFKPSDLYTRNVRKELKEYTQRNVVKNINNTERRPTYATTFSSSQLTYDVRCEEEPVETSGTIYLFIYILLLTEAQDS